MKTYRLALTPLLALMVLFECSQSGDKRGTTFQANPRHTGVYATKPFGELKRVKFTFQTQGHIRSTPAVVGNVLFFGSGDSFFYALDAISGTELWRFKTGGAVHSSPAVEDGVVYFTSRDRMLYALDAKQGREKWHFQFDEDTHYQYGFDYYTSSPTLENGIIYVGGGDGYLYAINAETGGQIWKFAAGSRIRNSPAIEKGTLVFGTMNGHVIALDVNGRKLWDYATFGTTLNFEDYGYDRAAVLSSPSIADDIVTVGCRDGFLYALELKTGALRWKFDHNISWAISTPGRADGKVYCGSSDGHFYQSVDLLTGKEEWRFTSKSGVWSSPAIAGNELYFADFGGYVYGIDRKKGKEIWRYKTSGPVYASPAINDRVLYCGSDDGRLYAFEGTGTFDPSRPKPRKAVFWEDSPGFKWFQNGVDTWIRDYFKNEGYEILDAKGLSTFMKEQASDTTASVVVFADNRIPNEVAGGPSGKAPVRRYLDAGGKIVFLGPSPMAHQRDSSGNLTAIDFSIPSKVFGVQYPGNRLDMKGWYKSQVTQEGISWGLSGWWVGVFTAVETNQVSTVLAMDEMGMAGAWVKNYGGREGTGLVQLWIPRATPVSLDPIKAVAEYGIW